MQIIKKGSIYVARAEYSEKDQLKQAGFWWHPKNCERRGCVACQEFVGPAWWTPYKHIAVKLSGAAIGDAVEDFAEVLESEFASRQASSDADIPSPPGLEYLPFQRAGIVYASGRPGTLIADEMGLGKTIQAIGVCNQNKYSRILVICPASLKLNWNRELEKWLLPEIKSAIWIAGVHDEPFYKNCNILIVNYERLKGRLLDHIMASDFDCMIVDECHALKNSRTNRAKVILGYWDKANKKKILGVESRARCKLYLTGTPILNKPIELHPILASLDPKQFGNVIQFGRRYCAGYQGRYGWDLTGASHLEELQDRLRGSIMVRRLKADVLSELPPKRRSIVELENEDTTSLPEDWEDKVKDLDEFIHVYFEEMSAIRHEMALNKLPACLDWIEEQLESLDKMVIFAHHKDVIEKICDRFPGIAVSITGDTSIEERDSAVQKFQNDSSCRLFVGSILAAGVGLTLTAASTVVFVEIDWRPGIVSQAEDRCHRIGQNNSVNVYHLVCNDFDVKMAKTILSKQEIIEKALNKETEKVQVSPSAPKPREPRRSPESGDPAHPSEGQIEVALKALRRLSGVCDGAQSEDGMGFNKFDAPYGKALANLDTLSVRQFGFAKKLLKKYKKQLKWLDTESLEEVDIPY